MEKPHSYHDSVPIFSHARGHQTEQKELNRGLNSLSKFCNNYHHHQYMYSSPNKPYIYGQQDVLHNSNKYKAASLKSGRNHFSPREPNLYYQYGSQHPGYPITSPANNIYSFGNYPIQQNASSNNELYLSELHSGWNTTRYSIGNTTPHFYSPQSTSNQISIDESCKDIKFCSDRHLVKPNTDNRQNRCYYSNKDIGSNYEGLSTTKEKDRGNPQQHKTIPLLNTSTQTKAIMHGNSKHHVSSKRGICFNETINKINLPSTRSSGEKLRENFCNISNTESNTLPLLRKAIEDTISRYRRDENEDKCDTKRTNSAAISTCISKCEHAHKKYNRVHKEQEILK